MEMSILLPFFGAFSLFFNLFWCFFHVFPREDQFFCRSQGQGGKNISGRWGRRRLSETMGERVLEQTTTAGMVDEGVRKLVESFRGKKGFLIPLLQGLQHHCGYLPADVLEYVAEELRVPLAEIYGVCTFYAQFHLKPRGRHIIRVCRGTACHVRGSLAIMERLKTELHVAENGTTEDLRFTLEPVACLGACGLAPAVMVDDETHGRLTPDSATKILEHYQ